MLLSMTAVSDALAEIMEQIGASHASHIQESRQNISLLLRDLRAGLRWVQSTAVPMRPVDFSKYRVIIEFLVQADSDLKRDTKAALALIALARNVCAS